MSSVGGGQSTGDEGARLHLLEAMLDSMTMQRIEQLGIQIGWHCLEVGAGEGSIARWLATRVGSQGKILATDIEPRFREDPFLPQLTIRSHDILNDELESGAFDLVHVRAVLMHLADPARAVQRMAMAVRPGGIILLEEFDWISFGVVDSAYPEAQRFEEKMNILAQGLKYAHVMDLYLGRHLGGFLDQLGFTEVASEGYTGIARGGDGQAQFQRVTLQLAVPYLIAAGMWTEEDRVIIERLLDDPSFSYVGGTIFQAWGTRQAG